VEFLEYEPEKKSSGPATTSSNECSDASRALRGTGCRNTRDSCWREEATMTALAEHDSGTAARILAQRASCAQARRQGPDHRRDRRRGARRQGHTAYLYWKTKEDLLLAVITTNHEKTEEMT
jgi:hypothetical protein